MELKYIIGDREIALPFEGETETGAPVCLLQEDDNLLSNTPWREAGYGVTDFLPTDDFTRLQEGVRQMILQLILEVGGNADSNFQLEKYHEAVTDEQHLRISKMIQQGWDVSEFPINFKIVEERMSNLLQAPVTGHAAHVDAATFYPAEKAKKFDKVYLFNLRLVRPGKMLDNNPPHRDVWLDRLRNAVNIYAPLCGSTANSSLALIPGSHLLKESEIERTKNLASINGVRYSVPCVVSVHNKTPVMPRPNPALNQVMFFSPYIIHGGGYNLEENTTRVSLEARFWRTA